MAGQHMAELLWKLGKGFINQYLLRVGQKLIRLNVVINLQYIQIATHVVPLKLI